MSGGGRISEELVDEVKACVADKKNPNACIDKAIENHGLSADDKSRVLIKAMKE